MKILELGKFYPPYRGGMETLLESFSEGFAQRGADVDVVVANDCRAFSCDTLNGVKVIRHLSWGKLAGVSLAPGYVRSVKNFDGDLIHSHFPNPLADLAILLGRPNQPVVLTYHSDVIRQNKLMVLYRPLLQRMLLRADVITVATPNHFRFSPWLQSFESKHRVIPFGIRLEQYQHPVDLPDEVRACLRTKGNQSILLTIGRLVGYKGHKYLVEAMKGVDALLWIVGIGPLESELKNQVRAAGLNSKVKFWGEVSESFLPALIQACDVFVLPSITANEAFGLVQIEAMAAGKPVISCDIPSGVPFVNEHEITGIVVPPRDPAGLAGAVHRLLQDSSFHQACSQNGKAKANKEYREKVMLDRYWNLFQELLSRS